MASSYEKKEFIPVIKVCEICGKGFACKSKAQFTAKKYCSSECRYKAKLAQDKARAKKPTRYKEEKAMQEAFDAVLGPVLSPEAVTADLRKPRKKKGEVRDYLAEDAVAARANGQSYGQYTSLRYAPTVIIPPEFRR